MIKCAVSGIKKDKSPTTSATAMLIFNDGSWPCRLIFKFLSKPHNLVIRSTELEKLSWRDCHLWENRFKLKFRNHTRLKSLNLFFPTREDAKQAFLLLFGNIGITKSSSRDQRRGGLTH